MMIVLILFAAFCAVALLAWFYLRYRIDNATDDKQLEASIDAEVDKFLRRARFHGMVVGVYKDGRSLVKGYGSVGREDAGAPDAATAFQIGSLSKLLTASLLQALCDQGVVSMDSNLGELLGRSMPLSAAARSVTLRQLATHTSGFPSIPKSIGAKVTQMAGDEGVLLDPYSYLGPQVMFDYLATTDDKRGAGRFEYSNFGMGLLGHVLEVVTGKDYESLVADHILTPLNMNATAITLTDEARARLAQGYTAKGTPTRIWTFAALAGAGAFDSNGEDMLRFIRASLDDGEAASKWFKQMREPQFGGYTGIGWIQPTFVDRFFGNRTMVWHNGMVGGYASYLSIDAQSRTGVVILANQANATEMLGMMLTRRVRTQSWSVN